MSRTFRHAVLLQSVTAIAGIGSRRAELLANLGIQSIGDLLFHFPRSFDDLANVKDITAIEAGEMQTILGEVVEVDGKELPDGRQIWSVVIADAQGRCVAGVWFAQFQIPRALKHGMRVAYSGKPKWFKDHWSINHPRVEVLEQQESGPGQNVIPVYPLTENLRAEDLREHIRRALATAADNVEEFIPPKLLEKHRFEPVGKALWQIHFPEVIAQGLHAKRRFIYEEFLILQVALAARRRDLRDKQGAPKLPVDIVIDAHIRKLFPFQLTNDQTRAIRVVCKDIAAEKPMQRLLQADVGAGKTAVAVYAMLVAVANKHQTALMAPTEVLARQHWQTLERMLEKSRVRRRLLVGGLPAKQRQQILDELRAGEVDLVVGTQALVQDDVQFARLGLVVVDEQHKFGVHQRARIRKLGGIAHYLVMTATPIPRTIALTIFGDLDVSTLREMPPGRQPVVTKWHSDRDRDRIYEQIRKRLREGRQAFVICPLVEESETLDLKAAEASFVELRDGPFKEFRVGLVHGKQSDEDKHQAMAQFREGKLDLLVATLVVEVGIDIPNATVMLIEHSERFGLSQLHQLRGRVSRGTSAGECHLFTGNVTEDAQERLKIFTRTLDGFELAEADARLRGLGEFFGSRQHGLGDLEIGDFLRDRDMLDAARADAWELIVADPGLKSPEHANLRRAVLERYGQSLDLAEIG